MFNYFITRLYLIPYSECNTTRKVSHPTIRTKVRLANIIFLLCLSPKGYEKSNILSKLMDRRNEMKGSLLHLKVLRKIWYIINENQVGCSINTNRVKLPSFWQASTFYLLTRNECAFKNNIFYWRKPICYENNSCVSCFQLISVSHCVLVLNYFSSIIVSVRPRK